MNAYDLNRVLYALQRSGCGSLVLRLDPKRADRGVMFLFQKRARRLD